MTLGRRPRIAKNPATGIWEVDCHCGFTWHSAFYTVAARMAVHHTHLDELPEAKQVRILARHQPPGGDM